MKTLIVCLSFLLLSNLVYAQPIIEVKKAVHEFGSIKEGESVTHEFEIFNAGDQDLQIQKVISSCGCTTSKGTEQLIEPQKSGKIAVSFDSTGFTGDQNKMVRVYSNDPKNIEKLLTLKGSVESAISISPKSLQFSPDFDGVMEKEVSVKVTKEDGQKISSITAYSKNIEILNVVGSDYEKKFTIRVRPELAIGEYRDRAIINFADGKSSKNVPVLIKMSGGVQVVPPIVSFGVLPKDQIIERSLQVKISPQRKVKLVGVESDFAGLKVTSTPGAADSYNLLLKLDTKEVAAEQLRATVVLTFDQPEYPAITVNVHGIKLPEIE